MNICPTQAKADLPERISASLKEGDLKKAQGLAAEIVDSPEALRQWLPKFVREFRKRKYLEPIIELLWAHRDSAMNDMFVVGCFMWLCGSAGLYDRFGPSLRSWFASSSTPDFTFSERGNLHYFGRLTEEQKRDFADAKYRRWEDMQTQDFFSAVDRFSAFASVSSPVVEFLFESRRDKAVPRSAWIRVFLSSEMLKHVIADTKTIRHFNRSEGSSHNPRYPCLPFLGDLVDLERAKPLFDRLDRCNGTLLCTIHDARINLAKRCLLHCIPERRAIGLHGRGRNSIAVGKEGNAHLAAFQAVKALRNKGVLFMVPDARRPVKQTTEVRILGKSIPFADGTPTIAFESGCATIWYTMQREGNRFVPVCVPGPSREAKESFAAFKDRWWSFYAARVNEHFAGDPQNITLWHFWPDVLYATATSDPCAEDYLEDDVGEG